MYTQCLTGIYILVDEHSPSCFITPCSTMCGCIKGIDSSRNSIVRKVGIYRTGGEFIEPEAVRKRIRMPSLAFYDHFSCYKPVKTPSLVQYGNCRTRSVVSTTPLLRQFPYCTRDGALTSTYVPVRYDLSNSYIYTDFCNWKKLHCIFTCKPSLICYIHTCRFLTIWDYIILTVIQYQYSFSTTNL